MKQFLEKAATVLGVVVIGALWIGFYWLFNFDGIRVWFECLATFVCVLLGLALLVAAIVDKINRRRRK